MTLTDDQFKEWMVALKSGEYKQGKAKLVARVLPSPLGSPAKFTFCCMGVCAVTALNLPAGVLSGFGYLRNVIDSSPFHNPFTSKEEDLLALLNDDLELTFPQIAAFIEGTGLEGWEMTFSSGNPILHEVIP